MRFKRMKGIPGLIFVPEDDGGAKKHPCRDCHFCQWCSDERCALCLKGKLGPPPGSRKGAGRRRKA